MMTKQIPIEYLTRNEYNVEVLKALALRIEDAQEQTGIPYFGWVADLGPEDGVARETGIISPYDFIDRPASTYDLAAVKAATEVMQLEVSGLRGLQALKVGDRVIATVSNDFYRRGNVGTIVEDTMNAYWPQTFPVRWDLSGKVTFSHLDAVVKIEN